MDQTESCDITMNTEKICMYNISLGYSFETTWANCEQIKFSLQYVQSIFTELPVHQQLFMVKLVHFLHVCVKLTVHSRHSELSPLCLSLHSSSRPHWSHDHTADQSEGASGHHGDQDHNNL